MPSGRIQVPSITVPAGTAADAERVGDALETAGYQPLCWPLRVLRALSPVLREKNGSLNPVLLRRASDWKVIDLELRRPLAAAVDVGTTNLEVTILDPVSGEVRAEGMIANPQIAFSEDVLDRILHSDRRMDELRDPLIDSLNGLVGRLAADAGGGPGDVVFFAVAGNTAMTHFLLGVEATGLPVAPHNPVVHGPGFISASDLGLLAHPEAEAFVVQNVGAFAGGDLVAGMLAAGFAEGDGIRILVDVGTNAEVAVTNGEWILVGAGAAGPALEGGVVSEGGRALKGSVERVRIRDGKMQVRTVGKAPARGICGSGLIDMLAVFFELGWIDGRGRLTGNLPRDRRVETEGDRAGITLVLPEDTAAGSPLVVTERDMENLIRSKAAMYAILKSLTGRVGVSFEDVLKFFVAGSFGQYIRPESAVAIGMLPPVPIERFESLGNAALRGCEDVVRDSASLDRINDVCGRVTYIDMNADELFMRELPAAMFIPHTNEKEFGRATP